MKCKYPTIKRNQCRRTSLSGNKRCRQHRGKRLPRKPRKGRKMKGRKKSNYRLRKSKHSCPIPINFDVSQYEKQITDLQAYKEKTTQELENLKEEAVRLKTLERDKKQLESRLISCADPKELSQCKTDLGKLSNLVQEKASLQKELNLRSGQIENLETQIKTAKQQLLDVKRIADLAKKEMEKDKKASRVKEDEARRLEKQAAEAIEKAKLEEEEEKKTILEKDAAASKIAAETAAEISKELDPSDPDYIYSDDFRHKSKKYANSIGMSFNKLVQAAKADAGLRKKIHIEQRRRKRHHRKRRFYRRRR